MDSTEARALILMLDAIRRELRASNLAHEPEPENIEATAQQMLRANVSAELALALTNTSGDSWQQAERINLAKRALWQHENAETPIDSP